MPSASWGSFSSATWAKGLMEGGETVEEWVKLEPEPRPNGDFGDSVFCPLTFGSYEYNNCNRKN